MFVDHEKRPWKKIHLTRKKIRAIVLRADGNNCVKQRNREIYDENKRNLGNYQARRAIKSCIGNFMSYCCGDYFQMLRGKRTCIRQSLSAFWSRGCHNAPQRVIILKARLPINQSDVLRHCWEFLRQNTAITLHDSKQFYSDFMALSVYVIYHEYR